MTLFFTKWEFPKHRLYLGPRFSIQYHVGVKCQHMGEGLARAADLSVTLLSGPCVATELSLQVLTLGFQKAQGPSPLCGTSVISKVWKVCRAVPQ